MKNYMAEIADIAGDGSCNMITCKECWNREINE